MNQRQKELAIRALELGAEVWISVKDDVCCAWMAGDVTALDFWNETADVDATMQRLSISGIEQDVVTF